MLPLVENGRVRAPVVVGVGVLMGTAYILSPLGVCLVLLLVAIVSWALRDLPHSERRAIAALVVAAIGLRLVAVLVFFLTVDRSRAFFGAMFGDEYYIVLRSMWLRNIAFGWPISNADYPRAFEEYGQSGFLYLLAYLQMFFGPAPYAVHVLNITLYLMASLALFRMTRGAYGRQPAIVLLALVLFLPTLFVWSISALKEPLQFWLTAAALVAAVRLARGPHRLAWGAALVLTIAAAGTMRHGAALTAGGGLVLGVVARIVLARRWLAVMAVTIAVVLLPVAWRVSAFHDRVMGQVEVAAKTQRGYVLTGGRTYRLLDERLYQPDEAVVTTITVPEAARFVIRAAISLVVLPLPWRAESRSELMYLPFQLFWLALVGLAAFGAAAGAGRDPLVTGLVAGTVAAEGLVIAMHSGNIGTMVRLRDGLVPFVACLASVGWCDLLRRRRGAVAAVADAPRQSAA